MAPDDADDLVALLSLTGGSATAPAQLCGPPVD